MVWSVAGEGEAGGGRQLRHQSGRRQAGRQDPARRLPLPSLNLLTWPVAFHHPHHHAMSKVAGSVRRQGVEWAWAWNLGQTWPQTWPQTGLGQTWAGRQAGSGKEESGPASSLPSTPFPLPTPTSPACCSYKRTNKASHHMPVPNKNMHVANVFPLHFIININFGFGWTLVGLYIYIISNK